MKVFIVVSDPFYDNNMFIEGVYLIHKEANDKVKQIQDNHSFDEDQVYVVIEEIKEM